MTGLNSSQVEASRKAHGSNVIPDSEPTTFWAEFKDALGDPMIKILMAIAALMIGLFVLGDNCLKVIPGIDQGIFEPIGTLIAVFLVATISAKTAVGSDQKYRDLKSRSEKDKVKVIRDGKTQVIDADDIVVDDIVLLQSGDKIPADGTLIDGKLKVNNAALNGETEEAKKTGDEKSHIPETLTGDTFVDKSSLFRGAIVTDGEGYMRVEAVGLATMMGKMAEEMNGEQVDSPLKVKLAKLANQISVFGYISAALIVILYLTMGIVHAGGFAPFFTNWQGLVHTIVQAANLAILIIVCAVPEGLPLMISLVLMQNTSKMLDHNVLVRKAQGIETAGSLNILFSDKTGTITKGHLEVVNLFDGAGAETNPSEALAKCIIKNTQAVISDGKVIGGNMTDQALMSYVLTKNIAEPNVTVTKEQGFNSANKFSQAQLSDKTLVYKGAPERLLPNCTKYLDDKGKLHDFNIKDLEPKIDEMANKAMRMLAFAYKEDASLKEDKVQDELVLVGIAAIRDDVRPEARDAIAEVNKAGIQVVMITGDRLETAVAIAKDANLLDKDATILTEENKEAMLEKYSATKTSTDKHGIAVSSAMLGTLTDDEIKILVSGIRVIARALPTDKSRMVRICQEMGLVCGMTGDGVNDSPALKAADVGFAMGSGTEAAKEAGDLVIIDDNFKSIKDAILFGRTIYHNILKFVRFQLSMNVLAVLATLFSPILGLNAPLTVVMLLFVNLCCDSLASLMFGPEPALEKYMDEKPRNRTESIVSAKMLINIILTSVWLAAVGFVMMFKNVDALTVYQMQAMYFVFYIWGSLFNGFQCRSDGFDIFAGIKDNKNFIKIPLIIVVAQAAIICVGLIPVLRPVSLVFGCEPIAAIYWAQAILLGLTVLPIGCITKIGKKNR
jgi:magnesium-transporting ATPase (P-type)